MNMKETENFKEFGGAVGTFNITKYRYIYSMHKKKNNPIKELNIVYWYDLFQDEKIAFYFYKIYFKFKNYIIDELLPKSFNKENKEYIQYLRKELLTNKYSKISELPTFNDKCTKKEFWLFMGFSEEEALIKISDIQKNISSIYVEKIKTCPENYKDIKPNQIGYWLKKGYSKKEAREKVKERQTTFSLEKCIDKHGSELGLIIFNERQEKWQNSLNDKPQDVIDDINRRKSCSLAMFIFKHGEVEGKKKFFRRSFRWRRTSIRNGNMVLKSDEKTKYYRSVWNYTLKNDLSLISHIEKRGYDFHLDHKISITYGLKNKIPPEIIGHIDNLQILPAKENISKRGKCYSSLEFNKKDKND